MRIMPNANDASLSRVVRRDGSQARQVQALSSVFIKLISGGWRHTIAGDKDGQLYAWGWNKACCAHSPKDILPLNVSHVYAYLPVLAFCNQEPVEMVVKIKTDIFKFPCQRCLEE